MNIFVDYSQGKRQTGGIGVICSNHEDTNVFHHEALKIQCCSSLTGELKALLYGLNMAKTGDTVLTDQQAVVDSFNKWGEVYFKRYKDKELIARINRRVLELEGVVIQHVPSHSGIHHNLLADHIAKIASGRREFDKGSDVAKYLGDPNVQTMAI